jgi:SEC-C motif-containing protein
MPFADCCGRVHAGAPAATAEQLMRSRYSAFAVRDTSYLLRSWHSSTRPRQITLDPSQVWSRLVVLGSTGGGLFDQEGTVEFRALYSHRGSTSSLHENSCFLREDGAWVYAAALPL